MLENQKLNDVIVKSRDKKSLVFESSRQFKVFFIRVENFWVNFHQEDLTFRILILADVWHIHLKMWDSSKCRKTFCCCELEWHSSTSEWRRRRSFLSNVNCRRSRRHLQPTGEQIFLLMATFNLAFILKVIPIGQTRLRVWFVGNIEHPMFQLIISKLDKKSCIWHF